MKFKVGEKRRPSSKHDMTDAYEIARFWTSVKVTHRTDCWEWISQKCLRGYGRFHLRGKLNQAHIISYKFFNGEYPKNLYMDHICMNKSCVNPYHLRPVSPRINAIENNNGYMAKMYNKTHCKQGHEFNKENTYVSLKNGHIHRNCRVCAIQRTRLKYYRVRKNKNGLTQGNYEK